MWDNPNPYSKVQLRLDLHRLQRRVDSLELQFKTYKNMVKEQSQIIQALTDELGYVIERVPDHWAIVEKEEDYE